MVVAGTVDTVTMVEAGAKQVSEDIAVGGIKFAHDHIKKLCEFQQEFLSKLEINHPNILETIKQGDLSDEVKTILEELAKEIALKIV